MILKLVGGNPKNHRKGVVMEIRIKETKQLETLAVYTDDIEYTADLITATDFWNSEREEYEMTTEEFEWWKEYIQHMENDALEVTNLACELGLDEQEIWDRINSKLDCDMDVEHQIKQSIIEQIKEEKTL
ncbi:hypothetical protein HZI73_26320 (plasmid) [Vallitalea pronyensis]|uniref:Uncharacterized protein n=1 Tax=Vallitalea pronyensis TaxID=1348613 RepID=A0A8J8SJS8_9FIRM|nr:hypothetical protein [Vallitalea pronyensis]QUI25931.1 hypothetical protein HZI73_26320 [Vallitalea pronyensis]